MTAQVLHRVPNGPATDPVLDRLTAQEQRILELIGEGMTNRQITGAMYLAEKTIKNYVTSVLSKLGMARRTEAAVYAARHLRSEPSD